MRGIEANGPVADYTLGDFNLNQGVFTMMPNQDGWRTSPYSHAETVAGYAISAG